MKNKANPFGSTYHACRSDIDKIPDQLLRLNRLDEGTKVTVASREIVDKTTYDFANIVDALLWAKQVGSATNQPNNMILWLEAGSHFLDRNDILMAGESGTAFGDQLLYIRGVNLVLTADSDPQKVATIYVDNSKPNVIFDQSRIKFEFVTIELNKKLISQAPARLISLRSTLSTEEITLKDTGIISAEDSVVKLQKDTKFVLENTNAFDVLMSLVNGYILVDGAHLGNHPFEFLAEDKSEIFLKNISGDKKLVYKPILNRRGADMSAIYNIYSDGLSGKLKVEEYRFICSDGQVKFSIMNKAFETPKVYLNGLLLAEDEFTVTHNSVDTNIKLKVDVDLNDLLLVEAYVIADYIKMYDYEFKATSGQKHFVVYGRSVQDLEVYVNGFKTSRGLYHLSTDSRNTTISFDKPMSLGDKINLIMHNAWKE